MTLILLEDHERDGLRVRVTSCDCRADRDCGTRFVIGQAGHAQLWLCCGHARVGETDEQVEYILENEPRNGSSPAEMLEHGVAMFGLTWPVLQSSGDVVLAQLNAFEACPDWMCRLPIDRVWACRRVVFGRELTRVPRALWALHRAYVDERPAVRDDG